MLSVHFEVKDSNALPSYRGEAADAATAVTSVLAADAGWETAREIASVHLFRELLLRCSGKCKWIAENHVVCC